jgi:REP element-mobilizing transposase RayT
MPRSVPRPSGSGCPSQDARDLPGLSMRRPFAREALAYFISFRCYGTWLHGDPRGPVDRTHQVYNSPLVDPDERRVQREFSLLKHRPLLLDDRMRLAVESAIHKVCERKVWTLHALNVRSNHVHAVVSAPLPPERVMNSFKSWATRKLVEQKVFPAKTKAWSRHGSTRYLWTTESIKKACKYVLEGQDPDTPLEDL